MNRLISSMRPGGLLAFQHGRLKKGGGRDGNASLLGIPEEGEPKAVFHDLHILKYQEADELSDWQVDHGNRSGPTVKMLARKP